jgi:hypothetical protein
MNLVGKVPVEPLDEERLTNIERKLVVQVSELSQQPRRAPRRVLAFAGMAMAVAIAGFVGWKLHRDPVVEPAKPEQLAMKAGALDLGDAQITGSDFDITRTAALTVVVMHPGKLDLHVEHKPGRVFVVRAGEVEIEDIGTRFSVDFDGTNVDVRVTEGEVKVKRAGKEVSVKAGEAWDLEIGKITIAELDAKQAAASVASTEPPTPQEDEVVAPPTTTTGGSGATTGSSGSGASQGSGSHKAGRANGRKALEDAKYDPPIDVGISDPRAATAEYVKRAQNPRPGDDSGQMFYSIAVLQYRAKQDRDALYTLGAVLKRQSGTAYEAALWLNVHIHCDKAFDDDCRIAVDKYLAKFQDGRRAGVADTILKEISTGQ